tara:strand:+ start:58 stop:1431 length:1374 start_codon:yes stop_codon:yes gene_type:complete
MSQNVTGGSTSFLQISPSNVVSTGQISYRSGNPVVNFIIGETDRFLIGNSVRLCGNISFYTSASGTRGIVPTAASSLNVSPKLSAYSVIDQLVFSSQKNKNTIEHIRNYGRFLASYLPNVSTHQEALGHISQTCNTMPNIKGNKLSFVNNTNGEVAAGGVNPANFQYPGNSFCLNLPCGFLNNSEPIGLSGAGWGIGGLSLDIHLTPDSQVFNSAGGDTNSYYQLENLMLICEVINPAPDELSRLMSQTSSTLEYNCITSYYTTIASTNAIINFRLGLSRVLGFFMNFIPAEFLNNLTYDGFSTGPLINSLTDPVGGQIAPIKQVVFLKGGNKISLDYNLNANVKDNAASVIADPDITRNFMNTFAPFMKNNKSQMTPVTNNRVAFSNVQEFADAGLMFGVGAQFDNISGDGIDFRTENFGVNMETGLTSGKSHAAFIFVRHKCTLVMSANGVQIIN